MLYIYIYNVSLSLYLSLSLYIYIYIYLGRHDGDLRAVEFQPELQRDVPLAVPWVAQHILNYLSIASLSMYANLCSR